MKANDVLILPLGALLVPVDALEPELKERLSYSLGDYLISRPRSRGRSLVVNSEAAAFLKQFRSPKTVVEAVISYSQLTASDPEQTLDSVLSLIERMRHLRLLVISGSTQANEIQPTLADSSSVVDCRVISCVHIFEDVEVYKVADHAQRELALKILRPGAREKSRRMLEREAAILGILDGRYSPILISRGLFEGRAYLVTTWCAGADAAGTARTLRSPLGLQHASGLTQLCVRILKAYALLHARGLIHGDIHPGNVCIGEGGSVTLLDFGLSWCSDESFHLPPDGRGGLPEYMEPEYCQALKQWELPPPATPASEQYALAALCYFFLTGVHYLNFSLERESWLRQIIEESPRPFSASGNEPWAMLEQVLAKALSKEPSSRFGSVSEFAEEFARAAEFRQRRHSCPSAARQLLENVLQQFGRSGARIRTELLDEPRCSINYGASGLAYFFYRLACLRDDPELLATADLWSSWSRENAAQPGAFHSNEIGITEEIVGPFSLYHSETGVQCVQALISHAMGDLYTANRAVQRFLAACEPSWDNLDLTLGYSGILIGCASLFEALPDHVYVDRHSLYELGERTFNFIWDRIADEQVQKARTVPWLGLAHGWAGILYAVLRWSVATRTELAGIREKLDELANLAKWSSPSVAWPLRIGESANDRSPRTGWCHGSAGYVLLWTLAHSIMADESFLRLAEGAANHIWESLDSRKPMNGSLCCGYTGQGYALLSLYRHTGNPVWLNRSETLCERAALLAHRTERRASLYKGDIGIALLAAEMLLPELSCTPMFEAEQWALRT
ncbi:MAG: eukaryotic-like serine/threonine-protein kinase [Blastocatellia bacterium]|jgi:serine/threonine-protein kinase|nr:eukaryotic-like serine/threonine-protein kinase [Blastocatellia bacterium]